MSRYKILKKVAKKAIIASGFAVAAYPWAKRSVIPNGMPVLVHPQTKMQDISDTPVLFHNHEGQFAPGKIALNPSAPHYSPNGAYAKNLPKNDAEIEAILGRVIRHVYIKTFNDPVVPYTYLAVNYKTTPAIIANAIHDFAKQLGVVEKRPHRYGSIFHVSTAEGDTRSLAIAYEAAKQTSGATRSEIVGLGVAITISSLLSDDRNAANYIISHGSPTHCYGIDFGVKASVASDAAFFDFNSPTPMESAKQVLTNGGLLETNAKEMRNLAMIIDPDDKGFEESPAMDPNTVAEMMQYDARHHHIEDAYRAFAALNREFFHQAAADLGASPESADLAYESVQPNIEKTRKFLKRMDEMDLSIHDETAARHCI